MINTDLVRHSINKKLNKKFTFINLTPEDTTFYKGLAILMIVMHNFFHWLPPGIGENEQNFSSKRLENYIHIFDQPEFIFQATFSFLGHYGVQVFLFLSAYGLTKKYFANSDIIYFKYLKHRILKIYPAFLFSILIWMIYIGLTHGGIPNAIKIVLSNLDSLLYKLTFIANFIPGELYKVNGPWWFVSLIIQFYIVFPYMLSLFKKYGTAALIFLSLSSLLITAYLQPHIGFPLPGTILTHISELSIGIFLAGKNKITINYLIIIIITVIFLLSNIYQFFWYFSFSSVLILILILFQTISKKSSPKIKSIILFIGSISMYIFYINGFMRQPWINSAKAYNSWDTNILICCFSIVIVIAISYLMAAIANKTKILYSEKTIYQQLVPITVMLIFTLSAYGIIKNQFVPISITSSEYTTSKKIPSKIIAKGKIFNLSRGLNLLTEKNNFSYKIEKFDIYADKEAANKFLIKIESLIKNKQFWAIASHDAIRTDYPGFKEKLKALGFKVLPIINSRIAYIAYPSTKNEFKEFSSKTSISQILP